MFQLKESGRERGNSPSSVFLFYSGPQQTADVHPHRGEQSTLPSLPIQMLSPSGNALTDVPKDNA